MGGWKGLVGFQEQGFGGGGVLEKIGILCYQEEGGGVEAGLTRISGLSGAGQWRRGVLRRKGCGRRSGASGNDAAPSPTSPHVS